MSSEFYMIVRSTHSLQYYPDNKGEDFRIHLKKTLSLKGKWVVSLSNIEYRIQQSAAFKTHNYWVHLNICQNSIVGDTSLPLLRRVPFPMSGEVDVLIQQEFLQEHFIPVLHNETDLIHIYIFGDYDQRIAIHPYEVMCTLHFKQIAPPWLT